MVKLFGSGSRKFLNFLSSLAYIFMRAKILKPNFKKVSTHLLNLNVRG